MPTNRGLVTHLRPHHGLDEWTDFSAKRVEFSLGAVEPYVEPWTGWKLVTAWTAAYAAACAFLYGLAYALGYLAVALWSVL